MISGTHEYPINERKTYLNYHKEEVAATTTISSNLITIELSGGKSGIVRTERRIIQGQMVVTHFVLDKNVTASRTFNKVEH